MRIAIVGAGGVGGYFGGRLAAAGADVTFLARGAHLEAMRAHGLRNSHLLSIAPTGTISLAELVQTIERVVGKQAIIVRQPDQPGDVPITFANIDRARAALGYEPTTPPELGIERYWRTCASNT